MIGKEEIVADLMRELQKAGISHAEMLEIAANGCSRGRDCGCGLREYSETLEFYYKALRPWVEE